MHTWRRWSARSRLRRWAAGVAVAALAASLPPVQAALAGGPAVMPVSSITVGMTGVGRTVLLGTRVSEFQVRVLGVLANAGPAGDLVLFRASGPAIQAVGGLAAGMSGSPIYLDGRLAGAFSYSLNESDPYIGLFTPIGDMMRDLPGSAALPATRTVDVPPFAVAGQVVRHITIAASRVGAPPARPGTVVAVPAATPLFISGFGEREAASLAEVLSPMGVVPMAGGSSAAVPASTPLEPGSAIGVALIRGDVGGYAIGTLTYRDGQRLVAFGHPFMNLGATAYPLTNATILQTVRGLAQNIKVGAAGAVVGTISQDRPAAIGGTVGVMPRLFGVRVVVTDADTGVAHRYVYQIIPERSLAPSLVALGAQEAIERALNRSGAGTAHVQMTVRARGLAAPLTRDNRFYSGTDIAGQALSEVPAAMRLVFSNDFSDVSPTDMDMQIEVTSRQETAVITDAQVSDRSVTPGSTVHIRVSLRPFRGDPETRDVTLTLPENLPSGPALLVVRAGGLLAAPASAAASTSVSPTTPVARTLADAIGTFEQQERHTDVVAEILSPTAPVVSSGSAGAGGSSTPGRVFATASTPWVLDGRIPIVLHVGSPEH